MTGSSTPPPGPPPVAGPPPLPAIRSGVAYIVIPGTVAWFLAFVVLLFLTDTLRAHDAMIWLWTCLAGWVLGLLGLAIFGWQRSAARRGRRGAQTSALN
jgi:hypothetical protein